MALRMSRTVSFTRRVFKQAPGDFAVVKRDRPVRHDLIIFVAFAGDEHDVSGTGHGKGRRDGFFTVEDRSE